MQDVLTQDAPTRDALTLDAIHRRRDRAREISRVGNGEAIESGQMCITLDPDAEPTQNVGIADFHDKKIVVRYGVQAVFPGLYELVTRGGYHPDLLNPVRATATDECTINEEMTGWRALGCLEFLPGSLWAGAGGG